MKELKKGDEVWVRCVVANVKDGRVTAAYGPVTFRTLSVDCRPVEPEPAKEPTEAQKLAERTMKAMWAANDAVNERPPSVEPPECPQGFRHLEKGEKILASDVPVVPQVQQAWNQNEIKVEAEDTPPTTTSKHYYGPDIIKVTFEFTQSPNTLGTTDPSGVGSEELTVECEYELPGEEPFFVIRSDSGWSFDDPELFYHLLLSVKEAEEKCRCSLLPR